MFSFKALIFILLGLTLPILAFYQQQAFLRPNSNIIKDNISQDFNHSLTEKNITYQFDLPNVAYHLMKELDVYQPPEANYSMYNVLLEENTDPYYYGLKQNDEYCQRHRRVFAKYADTFFKVKKFLTDYQHQFLVRKVVIPSIGFDMQPEFSINYLNQTKNQFLYDIRPDINLFFARNLHSKQKVGKHFSCISQASNHIPGHFSLYRKDFLAESIIQYSQNYQTRPQCFNHEKFFPKTWILYRENSCRDFFENLNSPEYKILKEEKGIVFIKKIGADAHQGRGVSLVTEDIENSLREIYENGALCGNVWRNYLVQNFVHNPLLVKGHKFDFRMYMLIASTNPFIVYYHDGFLRLSLQEYDAKSNDRNVHITNTAVSRTLIESAKEQGNYNGMERNELKNFQIWMLDEFERYLLEAGLINDNNWLNNYLRPEFKKAMVHLIRISQHSFLKTSSVYELYGLDFILDQDMKLWVIEANAKPALEGDPLKKTTFMTKMLKDHFEIIFGLLKSRNKRIIDYVNELTRNKDQWEIIATNKLFIKDLKEKRKEFEMITKNRFEPEFAPSAKNGFSMIIDENLSGTERYFDLIKEECL